MIYYLILLHSYAYSIHWSLSSRYTSIFRLSSSVANVEGSNTNSVDSRCIPDRIFLTHLSYSRSKSTSKIETFLALSMYTSLTRVQLIGTLYLRLFFESWYSESSPDDDSLCEPACAVFLKKRLSVCYLVLIFNNVITLIIIEIPLKANTISIASKQNDLWESWSPGGYGSPPMILNIYVTVLVKSSFS